MSCPLEARAPVLRGRVEATLWAVQGKGLDGKLSPSESRASVCPRLEGLQGPCDRPLSLDATLAICSPASPALVKGEDEGGVSLRQDGPWGPAPPTHQGRPPGAPGSPPCTVPSLTSEATGGAVRWPWPLLAMKSKGEKALALQGGERGPCSLVWG